VLTLRKSIRREEDATNSLVCISSVSINIVLLLLRNKLAKKNSPPSEKKGIKSMHYLLLFCQRSIFKQSILLQQPGIECCFMYLFVSRCTDV